MSLKYHTRFRESGSAWGITGKLLAFRNSGGDTEYREFYMTRDSGNTWGSTQFSPAGSATGSATISNVSGSGDNITISISADSYLALELTIVAR